MKIKWDFEKRKLNEIQPWSKNPRKISEEQLDNLTNLINDMGYTNPIIIDKDNTIIAGHQRYKSLQKLMNTDEQVEVIVPNRKLSQKEFEKINLGDNRFLGDFVADLLDKNFDTNFLTEEIGFKKWELGTLENSLFTSDERDAQQLDENDSYDEDTEVPTQEEFEKLRNDNPAEAQAGEPENKDNPQVVFELNLSNSIRTRLYDLISEAKTHYGFSKNNDVFEFLGFLYDQCKDRPGYEFLKE